MKVLLTGMSGVGKSTLIGELLSLGFSAIDLDSSEWSHFSDSNGGSEEWLWNSSRVSQLLASSSSQDLFIAGCAANQGEFYKQLDYIILLVAPDEVMRERIATAEFEGLLAKGADLVVDTSVPLNEMIQQIFSFFGIALATSPK